MNKILLSGLAGLAVINAAVAEMSVEKSREICLKKPDKFVWVEKTERCVPINPCKSDNASIVEAYCNKTFADIQLGHISQGQKVAKAYIEKVLNVNGQYVGYRHRDINMFGQDYLPYTTSDGGYMVFEFDDLSDIVGGDKYEGATASACIIYNGSFSTFGSYNARGLFCGGLASENDCINSADLVSEILSTTASPVLVTSRYQEEIFDGRKETLCEFTIEK